jgi:hypothetical protein
MESQAMKPDLALALFDDPMAGKKFSVAQAK